MTPMLSWVPKQVNKSSSACLTQTPSGPKRRAELLVTLVFSGVPKQVDTIRGGSLTLAISSGEKEGKIAM